MGAVDFFEQGAQFIRNVDVGEFAVQQGQQINVILEGYFFFQNFVPGLLRIGLAGYFETLLPVGENIRVLEHRERLFGDGLEE